MDSAQIRFHKNTLNNVPTIKSATIEKIIEAITYEKLQDLNIVLTVLLCYRIYVDSVGFFRLLEKRFAIDNPTLPPDQYAEWIKNIQTPIRLRYFQVP